MTVWYIASVSMRKIIVDSVNFELALLDTFFVASSEVHVLMPRTLCEVALLNPLRQEILKCSIVHILMCVGFPHDDVCECRTTIPYTTREPHTIANQNNNNPMNI